MDFVKMMVFLAVVCDKKDNFWMHRRCNRGTGYKYRSMFEFFKNRLEGDMRKGFSKFFEILGSLHV